MKDPALGAALLYRLLTTGSSRSVRRVANSHRVQIYPFPNSTLSIDLDLKALSFSWPASTSQGIDSIERFAHALLELIEEAHVLLEQRGQTLNHLPKSNT